MAGRSGYEGSEADQLEEHLARFGMRVTARPLPGMRTMSAHSQVAGVAGLRHWDGEHRAGVVFTSEQRPDTFMIHAPLSGAMTMKIGGARHGASPGGFLVCRASELDELRFDVGARHQGVAIDRSVINERLAALLDRPVGPDLDFSALADPSSGASNIFLTVLASLSQAIFQGALRSDSASVAGLRRALPSLLLECIPNNYSDRLRSPPQKLAPRQVRRALELMHESPTAHISMNEVAKASGVSIRSLQYAFRDFMGMSPSEYWRRERLKRALAEIKKRDGRRPAEIAAQWGFENITRFHTMCRSLQIEA